MIGRKSNSSCMRETGEKGAPIIAEPGPACARFIMGRGRTPRTAPDDAPAAGCCEWPRTASGQAASSPTRRTPATRSAARLGAKERHGAHPGAATDAQGPFLHDRLPRPVGDRAVRRGRELAVPAAQELYAGTLCLRAARRRARCRDASWMPRRKTIGIRVPDHAVCAGAAQRVRRAAHEHDAAAAGRRVCR